MAPIAFFVTDRRLVGDLALEYDADEIAWSVRAIVINAIVLLHNGRISFTLESGYHRNKKGAAMPEASVASRGKLREP